MDLSEIGSLIRQQGDAFQEFKTANNERFKSVESALADFAKKHARMTFATGSGSGSGSGDGFSADPEAKRAFMSYLRTGEVEAKSMFSDSDPSGGYLIPEQLDRVLTKAVRDLSPLRQLARVVKVDSGDYSMIHSTLGTGATWVGERTARTETTAPSFQKISPTIGELYSMPLITQNLLDDSAFDLAGWIVDELSENFAAAEGAAFVTGDGVVRPRGFLTYDIASTADGTRAENAVQYIASGGAGAFASSNPSDKLFTMVHALKPAYRRNAAWLMSTSTLEQIRTFKLATTGDYIWKPGLEAGQPATLLGYPVFEDENMPTIAANSLSIAFGDWQRAYTIVDRSTSLLRDPFSQKPYVGFYAAKRVGGCIRDTRALKLMKFATS